MPTKANDGLSTKAPNRVVSAAAAFKAVNRCPTTHSGIFAIIAATPLGTTNALSINRGGAISEPKHGGATGEIMIDATLLKAHRTAESLLEKGLFAGLSGAPRQPELEAARSPRRRGPPPRPVSGRRPGQRRHRCRGAPVNVATGKGSSCRLGTRCRPVPRCSHPTRHRSAYPIEIEPEGPDPP